MSETGSRRLGDYRILREIGRGGMGVVYEAEQESLGRHVALKILPGHLLEGARMRRRFVREARAAARLHHTNIVPVFGIGEADGTSFYAMQFISGMPLNAVLNEVKRQREGFPNRADDPATRNSRNAMAVELAHSMISDAVSREHRSDDSGSLAVEIDTEPGPETFPGDREANATNDSRRPPTEDSSLSHLSGFSGSTTSRGISRRSRCSYWHRVADIGRQAAEALGYAHSQGVIHRDIKPGNLLLDLAGTIWITDFGLAKADDDDNLTNTGDILGTLRYMPPEALQGKADARSDIFSLGLTLYHLLALRPAYQEGSRHRLLQRISRAEVPGLRSLDREIPRDLETIIHKSVAADPQARYQRAQDLADDLGRFLRDEPIHARRMSWPERLLRWSRRNPVGAGLVAASFAAVLFLVIGLAYRERLIVTERSAEAARAVADSAEAVADTQTYYSLINRVREQSVSRRPGWTWTAWDDLRQAAALDVNPGGIADLTTLAVASRCSVDIRLKTTLDERRRIEAVAFHPDGRHLAMARTKGTPEMAVDLYDLQSLERVAEYRVPTLLGNLGRLFQGDRRRYQESFTCIAFSADEAWLAAGTRHGSVHCWDLTAAGVVSQSLKAFPDTGVERLVFSADGKRLFAKPSKARGWRVWNIAAGWNEASLDCGDASDFSLSPCGRWTAVVDDGVRLLDEHFQPRAGGVVPEGRHPTFSADGEFLALNRDDGIQVYHVRTLNPVHQLQDDEAEGQSWGTPHFFCGSRFLAADCDEVVALWEVASGDVLARVASSGRTSPPFSVSSDGRHLAVAGELGTRLFELRIPDAATVVAHGADPVVALDISPLGTELATIAEADGLGTTVSRWQTSSGQSLERVSILADSVKSRRFVRQPCDVVYSPDGEQLVLSSSVLGACVRKVHGTPSLVGVLGGPDWEPIVLQDDQFSGVGEESAWAIQDARASDGLATRIRTNQAVRIRIEGLQLQESRYWSVFAAVRTAGQHTGGPICWTTLNDSSRSAQERRDEFVCPPEPGIGYPLLQICLLDAATVNDGEWVELALGPVEGLDSLLLDCLILVQHERRPNGGFMLERRAPLCFGRDGHRLWMVFDETQVISWDVHEGSLATHWSNRASQVLYGLSSMACLAARPTAVVAGSRMGDLYGISLETGRRESVWPGPGGEIFSVAADPLDAWVLAGTVDGEICGFRSRDGTLRFQWDAHSRSVVALAFSADGRLLASGSKDRSVRLWRRNGDRFQAWFTIPSLPAPVRQVRLSADGNLLAVSLERERCVRLWRLDQLQDQLSGL